MTVTAVDDALAEGAHTATIQHSAASADLNYNGITVPDVTVHITDNDSPGVVVTESSGGTDVTEGGATDNYSVVLTTQPTANVTVTLFTAPRPRPARAQFVFTPANWNVPADVTVTAVDDAAGGGRPHGHYPAQRGQRRPELQRRPVASVTAHITDNDSPAWA